MTLISLKDLSVTLGRPLFDNLNLSIGPGDRLGIVAANGAGKSTLLSCLDGSFEPASGMITRARGLLVGHVAQDLPQGVADTPFFTLVHTALSDQQAAEESWRVDVVLDMLEVPQAMRMQPLATLSGGWQRMAMLARVWVTDPDILLLDEPTNHLDIDGQEDLERDLNAHGASCLLVSHDRSFIRAVGNRFWLVQNRRLQEVDSPEAFFAESLGVAP